MKKIRQYFLVIGMLLMFGGSTVFAGQEGNVYDDAELLSDAEISSLNETMEELAEQTGWNVYAVTTDDAGGRTSQAYADDFFDSQVPDADGIVLLIDMDNREIVVSTSGEAIRYLTDSRIEDILDEGYAYIGNGDYFKCLEAMADTTSYYYDQGIVDNQYNYDTETGQISYYHSLSTGEILAALFIGALAGIIVYLVIIGKYRLKFGTYQYDYREFGNLKLEKEEDHFVSKNVVHHHIQRESSSGGSHSSSASSTHTSSGGHTHGGGSRKF